MKLFRSDTTNPSLQVVDGNHTEPTPLFFFDEKRFLRDLNSLDPITVFQNAIEAANKQFDNRFEQGEQIRTLVYERAAFIDRVILHAWNRFNWDQDITLMAVGGYGRKELHPFSDIDLLVLTRRQNHSRYQDSMSQFLAFLFDIKLQVSWSIRTVKQCVQEARADITIATNLLESRRLTGNAKLASKLFEYVDQGKLWHSKDFFQAKRDEQKARHAKHGNTEYNLEPNIKDAPGGLRDIQTISWIAKWHFRAHNLADLAGSEFLSEEEYQVLRLCEEFLWRVRYGLHMIAGRAEERMLFDHQRKLANLFGYRDDDKRLAVEQFMQRYYRIVLTLHEHNDVLLQYLDEVILCKDLTHSTRRINERFQVRDDHIEAIDDSLFADHPSALLEIFVLLGEDPDIVGVRSKTIRQIGENRHRIDAAFRANRENKRLFIRLLNCQGRLSTQLQRMTRYGVLGNYLPEFDRIIGQTQHDLFHIYPVDAHTIQVIRNMRRLGRPEMAEDFPVACHVFKNLPKPVLLLIAGLYHDIGKGRGGDHSKLGAEDVAAFAVAHGFTDQEVRLLKWLVQHHLLMSSISQREDISDPEVIHRFAQLAGSQLYLDYLFVLTVADITATNPNLWNGWKGSLLRQLYFETREALKRGLENPGDRQEWIDNTRREALSLLNESDVATESIDALWRDLDDELFLRESAQVIARYTQLALARDSGEALVHIEDAGVEDPSATRIFIYARGLRDAFPTIAAALDNQRINIVDARLYSGGNQDYTLHIYYALDEEDQPFASDSVKLEKVRGALLSALANSAVETFQVHRRTPRQLKQLTTGAAARIDNTISEHCSYLEVIAPDRPGLLAQLGQIFQHFDLRLHSAKIATLGERVEDVFYITDANHRPILDPALCREIEAMICQQLDSRNVEDSSSDLLSKTHYQNYR